MLGSERHPITIPILKEDQLTYTTSIERCDYLVEGIRITPLPPNLTIDHSALAQFDKLLTGRVSANEWMSALSDQGINKTSDSNYLFVQMFWGVPVEIAIAAIFESIRGLESEMVGIEGFKAPY